MTGLTNLAARGEGFFMARARHNIGVNVDACLDCGLTELQRVEYGNKPCAPRWPLGMAVPLRRVGDPQ